MAKRKKRSRRERHPWSGFAYAATFWFWGVILFYSPTYLSIEGVAQIALFVLGGILLAFSFASAALELSKLLENEGLRSWGIALLFGVLGGLLHLSLAHFSPPGAVDVTLRAIVLILMALSGLAFFDGIPYLLWNRPQNDPKAISRAVEHEASTRDWGKIWHTLATLVAAMLTLASALLALRTDVFV